MLHCEHSCLRLFFKKNHTTENQNKTIKIKKKNELQLVPRRDWPLSSFLGRGWGGFAGASILCLVAGEARRMDGPDALGTLIQ